MVDRFLVKNPLAYGVFFLVILLVFWGTFTIGQYPMDWMQAGVTWLTETLTNVLPKDRWYVDLLASGVVGGVGTVIVFLPQILILYFFISILEDSGYLARTALLFDPCCGAWDCTASRFFRCSRVSAATCRPSWPHAPLRTERVDCSR